LAFSRLLQVEESTILVAHRLLAEKPRW